MHALFSYMNQKLVCSEYYKNETGSSDYCKNTMRLCLYSYLQFGYLGDSTCNILYQGFLFIRFH